MKVVKKEIEIKAINLKSITVDVIGKTPLLMDKFSDQAKETILAKQTGVSMGNKSKIRDTEREVLDAIHMTTTGVVGFPTQGFKAGMMESTSFVGDRMFSKKLVSGAVKILNGVDGLIPIDFSEQTILEHNIGCNTKFSPQFNDWSCTLVISFDANNISGQDIITLLNYAGFYIGVGAWRPKAKGGSGEYGMYEVKQKS